MSLTPAILDAMIASGCTAEQIAAVVKAAMVEEVRGEDARLQASRKRTQEYRKRRNLSDNEWAALTRLVVERDGWVCSYCDCDTSLVENGYSIDHVFPLARGGNNDIDNLTMACRSCNSSKGDKILDDEWTPPNDDFAAWQRRGEPN